VPLRLLCRLQLCGGQQSAGTPAASGAIGMVAAKPLAAAGDAAERSWQRGHLLRIREGVAARRWWRSAVRSSALMHHLCN